MTVRINKPALNLREELTKAQSVVPYVQQQFWFGLLGDGSGEFTGADGTNVYTTYTAWSNVYNSTFTIQNNKGRLAPSGGYPAARLKVSGLTVGKSYRISAEFQSNGISKTVDIESTAVVGDGTLQQISHTFTASDSSQDLQFRYDHNLGWVDFDNIQVFEVDENDEVIHSLPLGFKPLHVYEDGLIQREGDVHDYTVVKTGGAYAIKPTVQPTATTETCIIAEREL